MGLFNLKGRKNATKLLELCDYIIESYEEQNPHTAQSCKTDVKIALYPVINANIRELSQWDTLNLTQNDWNRSAHALITQTTFDLLASGKYHLFYGMLNPMNCSVNLMHVYRCCMEYAVKTGQITEEERKEQLDYLVKCISEVG